MSQVRTNDANNANTNREVTFKIDPANGEEAANMFLALQGPATAYPYYGKIQNATAAQQLAQLRLSLITRVLSRWAILVGVRTVNSTVGALENGAVKLTYEQDEMGVFFNNDWPTNLTTEDKHAGDGTQSIAPVGQISDSVGIGGMNAPKSKPGLAALCAELDAVSYDGGASGPFSLANANITLPDGTVAAGSDLVLGSTMTVVYVDPNV